MWRYQLSSIAQLCPTLCDPMGCSTLGFPVHHQLLEPTQTHVHWVSNAIQLFHPLSSPSPHAFNLSQHQGLFQWIGSLHQVAKCWSFSFCNSPSNEYSGLISFRIDWFGLLAVQGTLKSLLQHRYSYLTRDLTCPAHIKREEITRTHTWRVHAQSCLTLCDAMNFSPAGSSVHGIS